MTELAARPIKAIPTLLGIALLGVASVPIAAELGNVSPRLLVIGALGAACLAGLAVAGFLKRTLLFLFVLALTYNRQYYSFEWLQGDLGGRGLYWGPSDLCLLGLLILWPVERALGAKPLEWRPGIACWLLPLVAVAVVSATTSIEPIGSTSEVLRYVKMALLLVYLRWNIDREAALVVVSALAAAILAQAPIAVLQVAFASGQNGLSQIFHTSEPGELARRAAGTLGHPNYLAPYMLLVVPPFVAVALGAPRSQIGFAAALVAGAGVLTIVLTQSRSPIVLVFVAIFAIVALLSIFRVMPPLRAIALAVAAANLLVLATLPLAGTIEKRLTGDLGASIDFRESYNKAATRMWEHNPIFGVGPNNFGLEVRKYSPDAYVVMALDALDSDKARSTVHLRSIAPVHNVYLLLLSELGALGLGAFLLFLFRALTVSWAAAASMRSVESLFALGLFCSIVAECVQQLLDYSLLWDPLLFTLTLLVGLAATMAPLRSRPT